jgi:hypothetical protein
LVAHGKLNEGSLLVDVQFKAGEAIILCNLDAEVVAKGLIIGVGGQGCVHHGVPIKESWFRVQLSEIVVSKGNTLLLVPNENDAPPQCVLKDVIGSSTVWEGRLMRKHA